MNDRRLRVVGVGALAVVGVALTVAHLHHALMLTDPVRRLLEALLPVAFALASVAAAGWLYRKPYSGEEVGRVLAWAGVGVVVMWVVLTWTIGHRLLLRDVEYVGYVFANSATAGVVLGIVGGVYDVERRRRTAEVTEVQSVVERERDRFATLFENVPSPTVYFEYDDGEPIAIDVNPAFEEVFGFPESRVVGEPIDEFVVPPSEAEEAARLNRRLKDEDLQVEVTRRTAEGRREFILYTVPLASEPDRGFATYVDITEQKRREQRLEVLTRVLRHDLRNAVNVIAGQVDALVDADDRADRSAAAEAIRRRSDRLLATSRKARTVERVLEAATAPNRPVDLRALVRDRLAAAREEHAGLRLDAALPDGPVWVHGNDLLAVAVDNLIDNAVEHAGEAPQVAVTLSDGDPAVLTFNDDGPGIPDAELDVIERREETDLEHASGLGLWLVTWIVSDVDGDVAFETTPVGTQVTIELERAEPAADRGPEDWSVRGARP